MGTVMKLNISRREFVTGSGALALSNTSALSRSKKVYTGPNVVIVRFGGGVRRRETIDPVYTYAPYLRNILAKQGTLFTNMNIENLEGVITSHGEGTLYILTGKYEKYKDVSNRFLGAQYEASVPTLFEYLRKFFLVAPHEALLVNGENRPDEEFYTFGNHRMFGARYKSETLSLYRFKTYLLRKKIQLFKRQGKDTKLLDNKLKKLEAFDIRRVDAKGQVQEIEKFWADWEKYYGADGLKNPRGDRLLTELTVRAIKQLRPKLLMVNYQDPDYVHWGNASHYTRGIAIIDQGLRRLYETVNNDPEYHDNTIFVVVPDCGRDANTLMSLPYQHHFNTKSAHEVWALIVGPGIARNVIVDHPVQQISIAKTIGQVMGFPTRYAEAPVLEEAFL